MSNQPMRSFVTRAKEPATVDIDGEIYEVLSGDHLDSDREAEMLSLFKEHERVAAQYNDAKDRASAKQAAKAMWDVRVQLIAALTNIPLDRISKLPMNVHVGLVEIIAKEMGLETPPESVTSPT